MQEAVAAVGQRSQQDVAEAAVVGRPDAITGTAIVAFVTPRGGVEAGDALSMNLRDQVSREIGAIAKPAEIRFTDALPKTRSGKIMRRLLRDVAEVQIGLKERTNWCRARGNLMPFFNFQLENGANLISTMAAIDAELERLNAPDGLLQLEAERRGVNGTIELVKTYDAATYVQDALGLVRSNIVVGGILATLVLLLFLRSLRTVGIVALAVKSY